jgi:hypothetical protein
VTAPDAPAGPAPSAPPPTPPPPPAPNIPPLSRRVVLGALRFLPVVILWVVAPYVVLTQLAGFGLDSSLSLGTIVLFGSILAALGTVAYVLRPTRAYGPLGAAGSALTTAYLLLLSQSARFTVGGTGDVSVALSYGTILELFAVVPLFGLAASIVTTVEDFRRPTERLLVEYPPR